MDSLNFDITEILCILFAVIFIIALLRGVMVIAAFGILATIATALIDDSARFQLTIAAAVAFFAIGIIGRRWANKVRKERDRIIPCPLFGCEGVMKEGSSGDMEGSINIGGNCWRAKSVDGSAIAKGEKVRVKGALSEDSALMLVEKLSPEKKEQTHAS